MCGNNSFVGNVPHHILWVLPAMHIRITSRGTLPITLRDNGQTCECCLCRVLLDQVSSRSHQSRTVQPMPSTVREPKWGMALWRDGPQNAVLRKTVGSCPAAQEAPERNRWVHQEA